VLLKKVLFFILILLYCFLVTGSFLQAEEITVLMNKGDALWLESADLDRVGNAIAIYEKVLELDPDNYEALWKIARSYFLIGDALPETEEFEDRHKECGEKGMSYAKRALEIKPQEIEGHYYYGLSIAQYSIGINIVKALVKGLGPTYEKHIGKAIEINKLYNYGGPLRAMGRYWYKLPWPKRNIDKSIDYLKEAESLAPLSTRGRVYLAESYLKSGEKDLARQQLKTAIDMEHDLDKEFDALRWKERAQNLLNKHF
jgi:tetratricopeptide (TPR) repeat protein